MFTNTYKNIIAIFLLLLVTACGNSGSSLPGAAPGSTPGATANPSVRILGNNTNIIISFGKTMDIGTLSVTGSLSGEAGNPLWVNNRTNNDTLVISPATSWVLGSSRTINVSATELGGTSQTLMNLAYDVYAGTGFFVSNDTGDDNDNGLTPANATKTITAAITLASTSTPAWIVVDGGDYPVTYGAAGNASHVKIMVDGVSLYGGYNTTFTDRDTDMYTSVISNNSSRFVGTDTSSNASIEIGNSVTTSSVIDGFTIYATTQPAQWFTSAILVKDGGAAIIQNNIVHGGTGQYPYGLSISVNASPVIQYNEIYGGNVVKYNSTQAGYSIAITSYSNSNPIIRYNRVGGGTGAEVSAGILTYASSTAIIHNNVIGAGDGANVYGVWIDASSPIIRNNTIYSGNGTNRSFSIVLGRFVLTDTPPSPTIENNNLFASGIGSAACIVETRNTGSRAASVKNNNLFNCPTAAYWASVIFCPLNDGIDTDRLTCTLADMETSLGAAGSGNVSINLTSSFLNFDGLDNNLQTMDDNDWRLALSTSSSVKAGGLNGGDLGWGYLNDLAGKVRPVAPAPWSIGAYEP